MAFKYKGCIGLKTMHNFSYCLNSLRISDVYCLPTQVTLAQSPILGVVKFLIEIDLTMTGGEKYLFPVLRSHILLSLLLLLIEVQPLLLFLLDRLLSKTLLLTKKNREKKSKSLTSNAHVRSWQPRQLPGLLLGLLP